MFKQFIFQQHVFQTIRIQPLILTVLILYLVACGDRGNDIAVKNSMTFIPAGEFLMGSNEIDTQKKSKEFGFLQPLYVDEHPQHKRTLAAFWIDNYEVVNSSFIEFFEATQPNVSRDVLNRQMKEIPNWAMLPVSQVTWFQAQGYCLWVGKRLPTEAEWEKAAGGPAGLNYPWGNDWNSKNLNEGGNESESGVVAVGSYPQGKSIYGVHDLAGNVAEWVSDWYLMYPDNNFQSNFVGDTHKVVRGGGWGGVGHYVMPILFRTTHRDYEKPERIFNDIGFRCAKDG